MYEKKSRSILFPLLLIGGGFYLLAQQFGWTTYELNWTHLIRLWPIWLVIGGFSILADQFDNPVRGFFKNILGFTSLFTLGAILLFGDQMPILNRFEGTQATVENIALERQGAEVGTVDINFNSAGAVVDVLSEGGNLLEGSVSHRGSVALKNSVSSNGSASVSLETNSRGFFFGSVERLPQWELGLSPDVPLNLDLDSGSGRIDLNLGTLQIAEEIKLDSGSGMVTAVFPDGEYDVVLDSGSGRLEVDVADNGRFTYDIDTGSGYVDLTIPANLGVRLEVDRGSGRLSVPERYRAVGSSDNPVYETEGWESADNQITIKIEAGSGSIDINE